jgi:hypothetical protein
MADLHNNSVDALFISSLYYTVLLSSDCGTNVQLPINLASFDPRILS